jgi:hypothetical protein
MTSKNKKMLMKHKNYSQYNLPKQNKKYEVPSAPLKKGMDKYGLV